MGNSLYYLLVAFTAFALTSCQDRKEISVPASGGEPYEMWVVADPEIWNRAAGKALTRVLDSDVPGLPQSEPAFRVMHALSLGDDSASRLARNIIKIDIKENYTAPSFNLSKDLYAIPQMILTIQAPNEKEFAKFVTANEQTIKDFFTRVEMNRQILRLKESHSKYISAVTDSLFGVNVWLPAELTKSKRGEGFFWASTHSATGDCNFVIYTYPYTGKKTFTKEYFVHKRDSVMKSNVPGAKEGMYMMTDSLLTDVRFVDTYNKKRAMEARGLWRMKGDAMGGPYVSLSRLDETNRRIVAVEVFVYSPDKMKRNLIRQMEASLYTLKFSDESRQGQIPMGISKEENK